MRRRDVLAGLGGLAAASACASVPAKTSPVQIEPRFPPVQSSLDRVTRTVVGLRPFRPQGFRLESELIGDRQVLHNYGHGGCGVTLSWGTSGEAADMIAGEGPQEVAVLGAGVMGLTSALILARRGHRVRIYAADFPPNTTSNVAGALWLPTSLYDREKATDAFHVTNRRVTRSAHAGFLPYVNRPGYGVNWVRHHDISNRKDRPVYPLPGGDDLYPEIRRRNEDALFGFASEEAFYTLMIDPDFYLEAIFRDALIAGATAEEKRFESLDEVLGLPERVIVNCSGLGAGVLFSDESLMPIRGQLTHLLPQPEIAYAYSGRAFGGPLYMFPRQTGLVLGGSFDRGNDSLAIDPKEVVRMVDGHARLAGILTGGGAEVPAAV